MSFPPILIMAVVVMVCLLHTSTAQTNVPEIDGFDYMGPGQCTGQTYYQDTGVCYRHGTAGTGQLERFKWPSFQSSDTTVAELGALCKSLDWCGAFAYAPNFNGKGNTNGFAFLYPLPGDRPNSEFGDTKAANMLSDIDDYNGNQYKDKFSADLKDYAFDMELVTASWSAWTTSNSVVGEDFCYKKPIDPCGGVDCSATGNYFSELGLGGQTCGDCTTDDCDTCVSCGSCDLCDTGICDAPLPENCVGAWGDWTYSRSYSVTTAAKNGGVECTDTNGDVETDTCPYQEDLNGDESVNVLDVIVLVERIVNV